MKFNFPTHTKWSLFRQNPARFLSSLIYQHHLKDSISPVKSRPDAITVVCVSDTHTTQPILPDGGLLLHAGDLSQTGSFQEIQPQLDWLNSQPHKYKVVIDSNHDLLLDPEFVNQFPQRILERHGTSRSDLTWGTIIYLNNNSVKLNFQNGRTSIVYGSPLTQQFGTWAFQHPPIRDVWSNRISAETDVLLVHGPPKGYLDHDGLGNHFLVKEIWRVRPQLVVFGHIHAGYGQETVRFDSMRKLYDGIRLGDRGVAAVLLMGLFLIMYALTRFIPFRRPKEVATTTLVNAAVVGGFKNQISRPAITVEI